MLNTLISSWKTKICTEQKALFYTQVSLCVWQMKQGILGETMPLIRDLLNFGRDDSHPS